MRLNACDVKNTLAVKIFGMWNTVNKSLQLEVSAVIPFGSVNMAAFDDKW